ncbi:hypothetical protein [Desulfotruncus alcoholivorax]|uniref:hypothetical protein n=1 Tax=Desulfotruncus alcoholivorax TaxID=265477 RepID=UPI000420C414|nr:hypothetical protein [Desulfotruncus alcoholivorax]
MEFEKFLDLSIKDYLKQPWLASQAAGLVEAPGDIAVRSAILLALSALPLKKQTVCLASCADRDGLIKVLVEMEEYGAVISLLHSDLARWLPETGEFDDLAWLIKNLIRLKRQAEGKKARVVMSIKSGFGTNVSAAMMEAIIDEAVSAAAGACIRCLNGPGGDHRIWEIPGALEDPDLAENILIMLSGDPRALALLLEDDRPELSQLALELSDYIRYLKIGAGAAVFCLETITGQLKKLTGSDGSNDAF